MPKISVIMSVHNGLPYLGKAVQSIRNQTYTDFEYIIIDDASMDGTTALLRQCAQEDRRIRVYRNERQIGLTRSLNRALALAQGEYIARMDADDIAFPERLQAQLQFLITHPQVGVVGSRAQIIDERGCIVGYKKVPTTHEMIIDRMLLNNQCIHSSLMLRRGALDRMGRYDESFQKSQDYELLFRISTEFQLANIESVLVAWRSHKKNISSSSSMRQQWDAIRARWYAITRYGYPFWKGIVHMCIRIIWLLAPHRFKGKVTQVKEV